MGLELKNLVEKLNPSSKKTLEAAAALCIQKTNYNVELDHFLYKLLQQQDSDIELLLRHYEIDKESVRRHLLSSIDKLKQGCTSSPTLSPNIITLLEKSWLISSIQLNQQIIRSAAILLALIDNDSLRGVILESCPLILRIPRHNLRQDLAKLVQASLENRFSSPPDSPILLPSSSLSPPVISQDLEKYTLNLTGLAREGKLDPIWGRDQELSQMVDILSRRKKNNLILVGERGVGKRATVEGLAQKIITSPSLFKDTQLHTLDLGLLQEERGFQNNGEAKLKTILEDLKNSSTPLILFIDEVHTLRGMSANPSINNLLKQGEFRIIIATTWPKYQQYLEKEAVFTRWFEVIKIEEPPVERGIMMLRCLAPGLEKYHKVQILNEAIEAAVTLSKRFLPQRQLPEKAINLLDTACARVCVTQESTPPVIQELNNTLQLLQIEASMLQRETRQSSRYAERLRDLSDQIHLTKLSLNNAEAIWQQIKILKDQIKSLNHHVLQLESVDDSLMSELNQLEESARKLSQELNLSLVVDQDCIAQVLSSWTGIPTTTILSLQKEVNFESIFSHLKSKIIGQDQAPTQLSQAVLMSQEGLPEPTPPQASSF